MGEFVAAFITGLTAGGLSCLAVQGGLLTSSLAGQLEKGYQRGSNHKTNLTKPLLLFLMAKLVTHTILGFFLGWLGTILQLTPLSRAILQIAIGIFMIGNGLRMLNVHPFFRFFSFEPPAFIRRTIRRISKDGENWITPLALGGITILIPCGITQTMMALAVASGNPLTGAAILFAFVLGASPVFFVAVYFAMQLGARLEKGFSIVIALLLIGLGLFSIYSASNLLVLPSIENTPLSVSPTQSEAFFQNESILTIHVENQGYVPNHLTAPAGQPITLNLVTKDTFSCALAFVIPALNEQRLLPNTGTEVIEIPPQEPGTLLRFSCSMGMYTGDIKFS